MDQEKVVVTDDSSVDNSNEIETSNVSKKSNKLIIIIASIATALVAIVCVVLAFTANNSEDKPTPSKEPETNTSASAQPSSTVSPTATANTEVTEDVSEDLPKMENVKFGDYPYSLNSQYPHLKERIAVLSADDYAKTYYKNLKHDVTYYENIGKSFASEEECIKQYVAYLNDWDLYGIDSTIYSDKLQSYWNELEGTVSYERVSEETEDNGSKFIYYALTFDMKKTGVTDLKPGKNTRYVIMSYFKYYNTYSISGDMYDSIYTLDIINSMDNIDYQYMANAGLGFCEDYYKAAFKSDNTPLEIEPSKTYKIDLDGDGNIDNVSFTIKASEPAPGCSEPEKKNIIITVNNNEYILDSVGYVTGNYENFHFVDIDKSDNFIEIAVVKSDSTDRNITNIFRFTNNNFENVLDSVINCLFDDMDKNSFAISGNGVIYSEEPTVGGYLKYVYSAETNKYEYVPSWSYPNVYKVSKVIKEFTAYTKPDLNSETITVSPSDDYFQILAHNGQWIWFKTDNDTIGYIPYTQLEFNYGINVGNQKNSEQIFDCILILYLSIIHS